MKLTIEQALQKAIEAHRTGNVEEADRYYTAVLRTEPKHPDANHNMGVLAVGVGKIEQAHTFFKTALETNSSISQFWLSYIDNLIKLNRMDEARVAFDQARARGAHGDQFHRIQKVIYNRNDTTTIVADPTIDQQQHLINLHNQGEHIRYLNEASKLLHYYPRSPFLYNIIGVANKSLGKLNAAVEAYNNALLLNPNHIDTVNNLSIALKGATFKKPNKELQNTIASILDKKSQVRPMDVADAAISLLKFEPVLQKQLKLTTFNESRLKLLDFIANLNELPLLLKLMSICPISDPELENILTQLRKSILFNIYEEEGVPSKFLNFQSALALHCFTNEYIYKRTDEEEKLLCSLETSVKKSLGNNEQPSPEIILAMASYDALNQYSWFHALDVTDLPQQVTRQQITEPKIEEEIRGKLPLLEEITDNVSSKVREQYEESPYPRWINIRLPIEPKSILEITNNAKLKLHNYKICEVEKPNILIAGCGTGQHSIGTATLFKSCQVLAIDLSLSSLAYAKRKTDEFNIDNINYMQADILNLGKLKRRFHIIESGGVLHHMEDPMIGWKILTDCLEPSGLMKIGLYSELARQNVVKIKEEIRQQGIGSGKEEMKAFRKKIMKSNTDHHKMILDSSDFYSLSNFRDLLFHSQEHRFTVLQIKDYLKALGLKFCGFESGKIVTHFKQTSHYNGDLYDLNRWHEYEQANPTAFSKMYRFWCQKGG